MHCKDTILRTQNNWPYSKLIPNSGNYYAYLLTHEQCCAYGESEEEALENLEVMEEEFLEEINELYQEAMA